jgi:DNA-binding transcriptional MerR regulator
MASTNHHIGEVAERVGLSLRTVRFYEEQGLITPEGRTDGGFRLYTEEHVDRLLLIKHMKPLGFSIQQMRELLDTRDALATLSPDDGAYPDALARFSAFADAASTRVGELKATLATAEALARQLRRERRSPQAIKNR